MIYKLELITGLHYRLGQECKCCKYKFEFHIIENTWKYLPQFGGLGNYLI